MTLTRYIITGATGHIGNNFIRYLNEHDPNACVIAIVRSPAPRALGGCRVQCEIGALDDTAFLDRVILKGDIVVHLAAKIDLSDKEKEETFHTNCILTQKLCNFCREKQVGRFVYVGSVDAIPRPKNPSDAITEPTAFDVDAVMGNYGKSKALAAQYILDTMRTYPDFSCAILLPSAVIGPHDYRPSAIGKVVRDVLNGGKEFAIHGGYQFIDVRDVCASLYTLCQSDLRDCYIVSGQNVSVCDLYQAINADQNLKQKPILLPNALLYLCMPFVKVLNRITVKALQEPHNYDCEKAKRDLSFAPMPFEKTMHDTILWFLQEKKKEN